MFLSAKKLLYTEKSEKGVQTIIRVYPHTLESNKVIARVSSENRSQTLISIKPDEDTKCYYPMFEYIPFQDIQESSKRVLNLPRKLCLQFAPMSKLNIDTCLFDDDGVNELCIELVERAETNTRKSLITYQDVNTQTEE